MQNTTIPNRASDAGPDNQPMDLTDWMFEVEWRAELANAAHKQDSSKAIVRARLEAAKEAIEGALGALEVL